MLNKEIFDDLIAAYQTVLESNRQALEDAERKIKELQRVQEQNKLKSAQSAGATGSQPKGT